MWIVAVAWMYVALMMAMAEATSPQGTWLGAAVTFVFYGAAPLALVMYLLGAPQRRKLRLARERAEREAWVAGQQAAAPDAASNAHADATSSTAEAAQPKADS